MVPSPEVVFCRSFTTIEKFTTIENSGKLLVANV